MQDLDALLWEVEPWWNWDHSELTAMVKLYMQTGMRGTMVSKTSSKITGQHKIFNFN